MYYSRTGNTRRVAHALTEAMPCELEEIADNRDRGGLFAYLRSGFEAWFGKPVLLRESRFDPADFDLVIVGTPIWNSSVSSPVRSYLARHRGRIREVAFFITCGGSGIARVTRQLQELTGRPPRAVLTLRERELGEVRRRVETFAAELRRIAPMSTGEPQLLGRPQPAGRP